MPILVVFRWHWVYLVWGPSEGYFNYSMIENAAVADDSDHRRFLEETQETVPHNDTHQRHYVFGESDLTDLNGMAIALCLPPIFTTMVVATIALLINVQVLTLCCLQLALYFLRLSCARCVFDLNLFCARY